MVVASSRPYANADEDEETADEAFLGLHRAGWDRTDRQVGGGRLGRVPEGGRVG